MKLKLLLLILLITVLPISISWSAGVNGLTQFGSFMTDGGTSYTGIAVGADITIKDFGDGLVIQERIAQFALKSDNEKNEIQGTFVLTIIKQTVSESVWNLYISGKTGIFNQTLNGDDMVWSVTGFEIGCTPWKKRMDIGFGIDLMPVSGAGDKTFLYGFLNFSL